MSLEVPQAAIEHAYDRLPHERDQDWILVVGILTEAAIADRPIDANFERELAEERLEQARNYYAYPVEYTAPTLHSSLRIVRDILTIKRLEETRQERLEGVELGRGVADMFLLGAENQEYAHRLREKGVLRIFDQGTNRSMWSVDFDPIVAAGRMADALYDEMAQRTRERHLQDHAA